LGRHPRHVVDHRQQHAVAHAAIVHEARGCVPSQRVRREMTAAPARMDVGALGISGGDLAAASSGVSAARATRRVTSARLS